MAHIEEVLAENGRCISKTEGDSMYPLIIEGKHKVLITLPDFPLSKGDVPLYKRDDRYVLHRIVKVRKNGYVISGDNRGHAEKDITDRDIIGVLAGVYDGTNLLKSTDAAFIKHTKKVLRNYPIRRFKYLFTSLINKFKAGSWPLSDR